jgi:hypothetical protein
VARTADRGLAFVPVDTGSVSNPVRRARYGLGGAYSESSHSLAQAGSVLAAMTISGSRVMPGLNT